MNMVKWKIGAILVLLILVSPMVTNAAETTKVYSSEEIRMLERQGYEIEKSISYTIPEIVSERSEVDKPVVIEGSVWASVVNESIADGRALEQLGRVSNNQVTFSIYKNGLKVFLSSSSIRTNESGMYKFNTFVPRESGYYKATIMYGGHPCNISFYASEKPTRIDSDGDGWDDEQERRAEHTHITLIQMAMVFGTRKIQIHWLHLHQCLKKCQDLKPYLQSWDHQW